MADLADLIVAIETLREIRDVVANELAIGTDEALQLVGKYATECLDKIDPQA